MIQRNGKQPHALGLEELILLKWPYYQKQSTDSHDILHRTRTNNPKIHIEPWKIQNF